MSGKYYDWVAVLTVLLASSWTLADDSAVCPTVKAYSKLHLHDMLGRWFVVQYYASSEELPAYRCMRATLSINHNAQLRINMNFTYAFVDDPFEERQQGNITWILPDLHHPAHWVHQEETYEGVYNTYVLDVEYKTWALLLHCAEKAGSPRYLSSFILSRTSELRPNELEYLRDKLSRLTHYAIDLDYMFPMHQDKCESLKDLSSGNSLFSVPARTPARTPARHPLKRNHKHRKG